MTSSLFYSSWCLFVTFQSPGKIHYVLLYNNVINLFLIYDQHFSALIHSIRSDYLFALWGEKNLVCNELSCSDLCQAVAHVHSVAQFVQTAIVGPGISPKPMS